MKREDVESKVQGMLEDYFNENNYELVDVEYVKEASEYYLRVYADKEGGITIDECANISRYLSDKLDADDFIENEYRLQVSSPGLDRVLKKEKDFVKYLGRIVELKTYEKIDGVKEFEGELINGMGDNVQIKNEKGILTFNKDQISIVKLKVIL